MLLLISVPQSLPTPHQTLLFSATMPKEIEALSAQYLNKPVKVKIGRVSVPTANVAQSLERTTEGQKLELLAALLQVGCVGCLCEGSQDGCVGLLVCSGIYRRQMVAEAALPCPNLDGFATGSHVSVIVFPSTRQAICSAAADTTAALLPLPPCPTG
jgi:superfamily II DNA/RNA helicase